jgi:hypothetical protein
MGCRDHRHIQPSERGRKCRRGVCTDWNVAHYVGHPVIDAVVPAQSGLRVEVAEDARETTINGVKGPIKVNLNLNLKANPNLILVAPTYTFATPVFGGQFALSLAGATGRSIAGINGTLTATVGPLTVTRQGAIEDGRDRPNRDAQSTPF